VVSSDFIESAAYLRMNTLTIGYTLPTSLVKRVGLSNFRVYATAGNLFCITGYSGLDPDVNTRDNVNGFPTPAYDYEAYPKARTFTFGINVGF
jgi:TonB-dependent starch-binding outer membrane protein SusC